MERGAQWTITNRQLVSAPLYIIDWLLVFFQPIRTTNNQAEQLSQGLTCSKFQFMAMRMQLSQSALELKLLTQWVEQFKPQSSYSRLTLHEHPLL